MSTMNPPKTHFDYLYVGGGVFGASAALSRKQLNPSASVAIVDQSRYPSRESAGCDINKIVSSAQTDPFYAKLSLEALRAWENDRLYAPHFTKTGQVFMGEKGPAEKVRDNYIENMGHSPTKLLDPKEAQEKYPILRDSNWDDVEMCTWNADAGWADAVTVLQSVNETACDNGVEYIVATVKILLITDDVCDGVLVSEKDKTYEISANKVILCAGAYIPKLLAESAPDREDIQPGERLQAVGVPVGMFMLDRDATVNFEDAPVVVKSVGVTPSESIPPGDKDLIKCTAEKSYTYKCKIGSFTVSVPPDKFSRWRWSDGSDGSDGSDKVPKIVKNKVDAARKELYGEQKMIAASYGTLWDTITPTQDFLICPHPSVRNLHLATGGSMHGFKYMPIIGNYINLSVDGKLDEFKTKRWAWDSRGPGGACAIYAPAEDDDFQRMVGI